MSGPRPRYVGVPNCSSLRRGCLRASPLIPGAAIWPAGSGLSPSATRCGCARNRKSSRAAPPRKGIFRARGHRNNGSSLVTGCERPSPSRGLSRAPHGRPPSEPGRRARSTGLALLKRVFADEILACSPCGGRMRVISRSATCNDRVISPASRARRKRAQRGSESTHWRIGACGRTRSTRLVAVLWRGRVVAWCSLTGRHALG